MDAHFPVGWIKAVSNTASEGAKMSLMSFRGDFNGRFIRNLRFPVLDMVAT